MGRMRLEVAVYDAAIVHNEREIGRLPIFQMLDRKRVLSAEKQATEAAKTSRKRSDGSYEVGAF